MGSWTSAGREIPVLISVKRKICDGLQGVVSNVFTAKITKSSDSKNKFKLGSKTPMDIKVYAWTRWWRSMQDPVKDKAMLCEVGADCQKVDTLFCSLGFEPKAGQCKAEYARVRGRRVPDKWKIQMNASMTTDL